MRTDRAGSNATPVVQVTGTPWGFAVDATNVYWASYSNGGALYRRALAGGDTATLRASTAPITHPIVDGDDIDFVEGINTPDTCQSAVWSVAKAGGTPRMLSRGRRILFANDVPSIQSTTVKTPVAFFSAYVAVMVTEPGARGVSRP